MKHFLILLLSLLSFSSFSQNNSWVKVEVQPDNYPSETTWEITNTSGEILAVNPPIYGHVTSNNYYPLRCRRL
jgi:hypothetical protein